MKDARVKHKGDIRRFARTAGLATVVVLAAVIASCGGGGGGGSSGSSAGGSSSSSSSGWVSGVFRAASTFKNLCQTVRTGVDIEGNSFPDRAGTALDEKNWLRSWTRETYLWNTEVTDSDPANGGSRTDYFGILKTLAKTPSGKDKDQFHFSELTSEYLARRNSAASASYGVEFAILSATVPRDVRVLYTDPGSPAEEVVGGLKKLVRGAKILTVDGVDLVNGGTTQAQVDAINRALFPPSVGITTTLTVRDPGATATRTVTLTSQNLTPKAVNRTRFVTNSAGNKVGYILFNTFSPFSSERELVDAMQSAQTQGVKDLVLDLRYNGGGLLAVASQFGYMLAGDARTSGQTFEVLRFNAAAGTRNPVTGETNSPIPFYKTGLGFTVTNGTPLPTLNLPRVFVLTTDDTCSASESVINSLRGVGVDVVQIGGKTCGKPYGFYPQDNCGQTYYTIQFQGVNNVGFGDYADGFIPANSTETTGVKISGCQASDDLNHELGETNETLFSTALSYSVSNACPASTLIAARSGSASEQGVGTDSSPAIEAHTRWIMQTNRDMTLHR